MRPLLLAFGLLVGCTYPESVFRPAREGRAYPEVTRAYRAKNVGDDCIYIGTIHSEARKYAADMAFTAAENGGTHYVVQSVKESSHLETSGRAVQVGYGVSVVSARTDKVTDRRSWATVYRCPTATLEE